METYFKSNELLVSESLEVGAALAEVYRFSRPALTRAHGYEKEVTDLNQVTNAGQSAVSGDTGTGENGIDQEVIRVACNIPHVGSEQVILGNEFPLGRERLRVVVGNHQLLRLVVQEGLEKRS